MTEQCLAQCLAHGKPSELLFKKDMYYTLESASSGAKWNVSLGLSILPCPELTFKPSPSLAVMEEGQGSHH